MRFDCIKKLQFSFMVGLYLCVISLRYSRTNAYSRQLIRVFIQIVPTKNGFSHNLKWNN